MRKTATLLCWIMLLSHTFAQSDSAVSRTQYSFIIGDSPAQLVTMRQMNQNYLSGYRLFARGLNGALKNQTASALAQIGLNVLFFYPLTHEEGHRAILTSLNIGSISQPYMNSKGSDYVKGVSDATLMNLRDHDLPNYIRLHTAGLESDYISP